MSAISGKKLDAVTCHLCQSFSTKRLTSFERHLQEVHGTTCQGAWDVLNSGPVKCKCGCGATTGWNGWKTGYSTFIIGHNANLDAAYGPEKARQIKDTRADKLRGKVGWAKGKTKENDARIRDRAKATAIGRTKAFAEGKITAWSKGKTKKDDARIAALATVLKEGFETGKYVPWAKGLTKETDDRITKMAARNSITHSMVNLRQKLDATKRLTENDVRSRVEANGCFTVISDLSTYISDKEPNIQVKCNTCNATTYGSLRMLKYNRCFTCDPAGSATQSEIASWLRTVMKKVTTNDRTVISGPKRMAELDIFIADKHLAIEYNGLYWHCEAHKSSTYHNNKTQQCSEHNVHLLHVFEDEWRDKRQIVKSMITHRLGLTRERFFARKCDVVELTLKERREFFNANHIDGDTNSTLALGLKTKQGELVAALSLRRPFHNKHRDCLEVARSCSRIDCTVTGGVGKLVAHAGTKAKKRGINKLMTYVDTRLGGTGNAYVAAGFTKSSTTAPRFWWTDFHGRFNRFKYRADKKNKLTEADVAAAANVVRIWGCANDVYELSLSTEHGTQSLAPCLRPSASIA